MNILCRLGLHSWRPHCKYSYNPFVQFIWFGGFPIGGILPNGFRKVGKNCRRCGKRVDL